LSHFTTSFVDAALLVDARSVFEEAAPRVITFRGWEVIRCHCL
jgi:hypothetical protein